MYNYTNYRKRNYIPNDDQELRKEVINFINTYYAYHRSNNENIEKFNLINDVKTLATEFTGKKTTAYGIYFNFDKNQYKNKGKYLYTCVLDIKKPYITDVPKDVILITKDKFNELLADGYDSVICVQNGNVLIYEIVVFNNENIEIYNISKN